MTYEVVTFNDGTEDVIDIEITDKDNLTNSDIRSWAYKHDISVYINNYTKLISLDTTDSRITKKSVRNIIAPRISSAIRLEVVDKESCQQNIHQRATMYDEIIVGKNVNKNRNNMNEDTGKTTNDTNSFDWSELPLEDQLYWSENWDGTGTIDDISSDNTLDVVIELPWGETFTESYDIPTPTKDNKSLKRLVEYCGYNLSVLGDAHEEIVGSDVPVHHENNIGWRIEEQSLTENRPSAEEVRKFVNDSSHEQSNNDPYTEFTIKDYIVWCCVAINAIVALWMLWQIALLLGISALTFSVLVVGFAVIVAI